VLVALAAGAASAREGWWTDLSQHASDGMGEGASLGCLHCRLARASAGLDLSFDEIRMEPGTARDLRNFAPDRPADFKHMKLAIDIPDMNTPRFSATQTYTLAPLARPLSSLSLNADQLLIKSVAIDPASPIAGTTTTSFDHDGTVLTIRFDPALPVGQDQSIVIEYGVDDPPDGLFWFPEGPEWPGRAAQLHTQGQPETNRYWFPAHDFPNERLTTEIIATVPAGYRVSSNGRLIAYGLGDAPLAGGSATSKAIPDASLPSGGTGSRATFHWLQDKPHVTYLVTFIVGKYDVVDVSSMGKTGPMPELHMPVYVPPGLAGDVARTYGRTADMVQTFETRFSEPYPWDRYAQLLVWNFGSGGMENTAATTMYDTAVFTEKAMQDDDLDGLISHELAHQWFGDLLTCNTWAHIWLNEGWATYSTALWYEARDGAQEGYVRHMHSTMRGIAENDQLAPDQTPARPGMVSPIYKHPWEVFRRVSNPYPKGSSILHMLRRQLGDELFFRGVGEYVDRYKFRTVETDDFRRTLEEVSGVSLEKFFQQWALRPGTPKLKIKGEWSESQRTLKVIVEQLQRTDPDHPAYAFDLPIEVHLSGAREASASDAAPLTFTMAIDGKRHEQTFSLPSAPKMVLIDADLHVLMLPELDMPQKWLIEQLWTGRSIASRLDACKALAGKPSPEARAALASRLREPDHFSVQSAAAKALGDQQATAELTEALDAGVASARVRLAVIRALGAIGGPEAIERLNRHARDESESFACRSAALEWLGRRAPVGESTFLPVFEQALKAQSQHDQVRQGALRGLAALGNTQAIELISPFTKPGAAGRTRAEAATAIARLAALDERTKPTALAVLEPLLTDREDRARHAAIEALVEVKHADGIAMLNRAATATRSTDTRERAEAARAKLAARLRTGEQINSAESEIDRLKAEMKRLETRMRESERARGVAPAAEAPPAKE
jgi:aminopeptidase N